MKELTKREEEIMQVIWAQGQAFIREIIEGLPEPRPHYNTIATIVKILVKKGFLKSEMVGNTHLYRPEISLETYRETHLGDIKKKYFGNSLQKLFTHFAKDEKLSESEINELINIIKSKKQ